MRLNRMAPPAMAQTAEFTIFLVRLMLFSSLVTSFMVHLRWLVHRSQVHW